MKTELLKPLRLRCDPICNISQQGRLKPRIFYNDGEPYEYNVADNDYIDIFNLKDLMYNSKLKHLSNYYTHILKLDWICKKGRRYEM